MNVVDSLTICYRDLRECPVERARRCRGGPPLSARHPDAGLSLKRARTVAQYLSTQGVRVWIRFDGIGDQHAKGRPSDRRVEIRAI